MDFVKMEETKSLKLEPVFEKVIYKVVILKILVFSVCQQEVWSGSRKREKGETQG